MQAAEPAGAPHKRRRASLPAAAPAEAAVVVAPSPESLAAAHLAGGGAYPAGALVAAPPPGGLPPAHPGALAYALQPALAPQPAPPPAALLNPQSTVEFAGRFGDDYTLGETIGRGTFSVVKRCVRRANGEARAVKIIDTRRFKLSASFQRGLASVLDEVRILRSLTHPGIIRVHEVYDDAFEGHEALYVVTELAPGGELFDSIIKAGNFSEPQARHVVWQALQALDYMHGQGVVHRDLKPENLLVFSTTNVPAEDPVVRPPGRERPVSTAASAADTVPMLNIKIADFGVARYIGSAAVTSGATTFVGSPQYVAPEVLFARDVAMQQGQAAPRVPAGSSPGGHSYGQSVDVYSLGVILYVCLAGYLPFDDAAPRPADAEPVAVRPGQRESWEDRVRAGRFYFAPPVWTHISPTAKDLIRGMMAVDPVKRLTVAGALAHPWFETIRQALAPPLAAPLPVVLPPPGGYAGGVVGHELAVMGSYPPMQSTTAGGADTPISSLLPGMSQLGIRGGTSTGPAVVGGVGAAAAYGAAAQQAQMRQAAAAAAAYHQQQHAAALLQGSNYGATLALLQNAPGGGGGANSAAAFAAYAAANATGQQAVAQQLQQQQQFLLQNGLAAAAQQQQQQAASAFPPQGMFPGAGAGGGGGADAFLPSISGLSVDVAAAAAARAGAAAAGGGGPSAGISPTAAAAAAAAAAAGAAAGDVQQLHVLLTVAKSVDFESLLLMQRSAALTFKAAYMAVRDVPQAAMVVRRHAVAARELQRKVQATVLRCRALAQAILALLPDLRESVLEGDAGLTQGCFSRLRVWVSELKAEASQMQGSYGALIGDIQTSLEQARAFAMAEQQQQQQQLSLADRPSGDGAGVATPASSLLHGNHHHHHHNGHHIALGGGGTARIVALADGSPPLRAAAPAAASGSVSSAMDQDDGTPVGGSATRMSSIDSTGAGLGGGPALAPREHASPLPAAAHQHGGSTASTPGLAPVRAPAAGSSGGTPAVGSPSGMTMSPLPGNLMGGSSSGGLALPPGGGVAPTNRVLNLGGGGTGGGGTTPVVGLHGGASMPGSPAATAASGSDGGGNASTAGDDVLELFLDTPSVVGDEKRLKRLLSGIGVSMPEHAHAHHPPAAGGMNSLSPSVGGISSGADSSGLLSSLSASSSGKAGATPSPGDASASDANRYALVDYNRTRSAFNIGLFGGGHAHHNHGHVHTHAHAHSHPHVHAHGHHHHAHRGGHEAGAGGSSSDSSSSSGGAAPHGVGGGASSGPASSPEGSPPSSGFGGGSGGSTPASLHMVGGGAGGHASSRSCLGCALADLRQVDSILSKAVDFWSSMEFVVDVVVKRKEHSETLLRHSTSARMIAKATASLGDYMSFWQAFSLLCGKYADALEAQRPGAASAGAMVGAGGGAGDAMYAWLNASDAELDMMEEDDRRAAAALMVGGHYPLPSPPLGVAAVD